MNKRAPYIIAAGLVAAAFVFGLFFYQSRKLTNSGLRAIGSATRRVTCDRVKWNLAIGRVAGINALPSSYSALQNDLDAVVRYITAKGIARENILVQPVNSMPNYGPSGLSGYMLEQRLSVSSSDLPLIESLAISPKKLYEQGVQIRMSGLEYFYSKIEDVKIQLLSEAAKNAKLRAAEIAKSTGNRIGRVLSANAGVFQIREPDSKDVSDYGIYNTSSKVKDVYVTVNSVFAIR
jgi:hypothetical protein